MSIIMPKFPLPGFPSGGGGGGFFGPLLEIGKAILSFFKGKDVKQEEIAHKKSLDPEKSEANEIAELNKLLMEYKQNIISAGGDLEREMIAECAIQMQAIM